MSAVEHLNMNQMKLFDSAGAIASLIERSGDQNHLESETLDEMYERKLREAKMPKETQGHGAGVYASLESKGWDPEEPLVVDFTGNKEMPDWSKPGAKFGEIVMQESGVYHQYDANHRLAAAQEIENQTGQPFWIPLEYNGIVGNANGSPQRTIRYSRIVTPPTPKSHPNQMQLPGLEGM